MSGVQSYVVNGAPGQSSIPAWLTQRSKNKKGAKRAKTSALSSLSSSLVSLD